MIGHPLGVFLALFFLAVLLLTLIWMLRVPRPVPMEVARAVYSVEAARCIVVPIVEGIYSERAVELACRLGERQHARLVLVHVLEVPYTVPLETPLPDLEARGRRALETARFIAMQHGMEPEIRLVRHRSAPEGILSVARQVGADQIVMGIGLKRRAPSDSLGRTVHEVMRRATCEVIVAKAPIME
ncbi:MAG TPA: universal stress protein [Thermoflexus sp.]|nr:universal stress protein [Thermoflexus sp.]